MKFIGVDTNQRTSKVSILFHSLFFLNNKIPISDISCSIQKYIRVSFETKISTMISLLTSTKKWNLKKPDLILSVAGGDASSDGVIFKKRLKDSICKSLVKAASATSITIKKITYTKYFWKLCFNRNSIKDAWVTTGGFNQGCVKLVGEAFKDNSQSIPVIGFAPWCSVANNQSLIKTNVKKLDII